MTPVGYRRLILVRHAKSDWDNPDLADHDRPLNPRGRRAARLLGDWLAGRGYEPEEVLCSTSLRTCQTWEGAEAAVLESRPDLVLLPQLYNADADMLMQVLRQARQQTVMMIAHNPGIGEFAAKLPAQPPFDEMFRKYPTAATLVVDFQIDDWSAVQPGTGSLRDFTVFSGR